MSEHPSVEVLSRFVDGRLSPERRERVEAHLEECGRCASHVSRSRQLMSELESLPREIPPSSELTRPWLEEGAASPSPADSGIGGALRRLASSRRPLLAAAVILVAFVSLWAALQPWSGGPAPPPVTGLEERPGRAHPALQEQLENYASASRQLARVYQEHRDSLAGEVAGSVDASLASLDAAIRRTTEAAERHPGEPVVQRMLLARYERKVELLRRTLDLWRQG